MSETSRHRGPVGATLANRGLGLGISRGLAARGARRLRPEVDDPPEPTCQLVAVDP